MSFAIAVHLQLYDLFPTAMPSRIEDYALIGDCQSAALVGRDGSIDWLCVRRFDSSACFAALLGTPENGRWRIAPVGEVRRVGRRYRKGTLVLETEFETAGGVVLVVDCMPLHGDRADVVRLVVGKRGRVAMEMDLVIRFDYGWLVPWVRRQDHGIVAVGGPDILRLRSEVELRGEGFRTVSEFEVGEGESRAFVLTWCPSHVAEPAPVDARAAVAETEKWWREWSSACSYRGEWEEAVQRSGAVQTTSTVSLLMTIPSSTIAPSLVVADEPSRIRRNPTRLRQPQATKQPIT